MMLKGTDKTVNFWDYAYQATFINLIYYALSMATVYIVKGRETLVSGAHFSTFIEQSCREMGPIQPREIKLLVPRLRHHPRLHAGTPDPYRSRIRLLRAGAPELPARHQCP